MKEKKRKPCPFCGESNSVICETTYDEGGREEMQTYAVSCRTRDCHGVIYKLGFGLFAMKDDAIKAWNKRAKP